VQVSSLIRSNQTTYRAVETKSDQHEKEDERPECGDGQRRDCFWIDDEHEAGTYNISLLTVCGSIN